MKEKCVGSFFVLNVYPNSSSGPNEIRDALYKVLCKYRVGTYMLSRLNTKGRDTDTRRA